MVPEVIVFDLGGVLVDFAGFERLSTLLPEPMDEQEIRATWLSSGPVRDFELGKIGRSEFADRFVHEWNISMPAMAFLREFSSWPRGLYPGAKMLLGALRLRYKLACLTNTNELHWSALQDSLAPLFDETFVSCELGLAKPDRGIFQGLLSTLAIDPRRVLFFDDAEQNVEVAAELGLRAELVHGLAELRSRLEQLELLAV